MSNEATEYSRAEVLAAEFAEALQLGENPSINDYVAQNQDCEPELREMLLAILAMEELKNQNESVPPPPTVYGSVEIRRLGDLRIVREIGRGGMGIVYEAVQESLGRTVAVKVLPKHRLDSDNALARFQRESKTAAKLHHTNIVPVLGVGTDDGYHYYVMQFIRGVGLDEVIRHLRAETSVDAQSDNPTLDLRSVARKLIQHCGDASTVSVSPAQDVTEDVPGRVDWQTSDRQHRSNPDVIVPDGSHRRFDRDYWRSVAWIAHRVAAALHYAHSQGILHRDIKPSNLLVDSQGVVSVADFGLAKSIDQAGISRTGDVVGTLKYMAPEQLAGATDTRSDVYSLGATLYELVTLHAAFDDSQLARMMSGSFSPPARPSQIRPGMPPDLETIIVKAMAAEPAHRYQSAAELSEDLRRFCEDRPILAKRTSAFEHLWRWSRRNPAIATLCVVTASLLVTVAAVSTTAYYRTNQARQEAIQAQQEAIEQRDKADRTAESAFDSLDEIFHSLAPLPMVHPDEFIESSDAETKLTAAPIPTKQTAALLEKMLTFYGRIAKDGQTDERYRERLAEAHHRIGGIRSRLGQVEVAAASYGRSVELYRQLMATDPSPTLVARLAAVHNELGICLQHVRRQRTVQSKHLQERQRRNGFAEFQAARLLLEPIATANSPPEVRYELAYTYYLLGDQPRGDMSPSRRGRNRKPRLPDSNGVDAGNRQDGHQLERNSEQAFGYRNSGQEVLLQKSIDMLRQLVEEYRESPDYRRLLAMCYMETSKGPSMSASPRSRQLRLDAIELLTALVEKYPENPGYRFALSSAYASGNVASPKLDRDAVAAYIDRMETAESLISGLRSEHPGVPQYLLAHLKFFRQLAALHRRLDGSGAELPVYRRATQVCRSARPESITNMSFESVIEVYEYTADLLIDNELGDQKEALLEAISVLEAGIQAFDQLKIQTGESNHDFRRAKFLARLTDVRERLGHAVKKSESR